MRKLLLFCLLAWPLMSFGQDWRPFTTGQRYGFRLLPAAADTTLYVLLVEKPTARAVGDTVWTYPQTFLDSGCVNGPGTQVGRSAVSYSLFGTSVGYNGVDASFYVDLPTRGLRDTLTLRANLPDGTTYTSGSHSVTFLGAGLENVLGLLDSVRRYTVDSKAVRWSRKAGIVRMVSLLQVRYEDFGVDVPKQTETEAVSLPGGRGKRLPTTESLYPYQPGDSLGYYTFMSGFTMGEPYAVRYDRYRFTSRQVDPVARQLVLGYSYSYIHYLYPYQPARVVTAASEVRGEWRLNLDSVFATGTLFTDDQRTRAWGLFQTSTFRGRPTISFRSSDAFIRDSSGCYPHNFIDGDGGLHTVVDGFGFVNWHLYFNDISLDCFRLNGQGIPCGKLPTAIQQNVSGGFRLAANPVADRVEVIGATELSLVLQDMQGRTVASGRGKTLSTRGLPAGLYLLRVRDDQGRTGVLRVVKE